MDGSREEGGQQALVSLQGTSCCCGSSPPSLTTNGLQVCEAVADEAGEKQWRDLSFVAATENKGSDDGSRGDTPQSCVLRNISLLLRLLREDLGKVSPLGVAKGCQESIPGSHGRRSIFYVAGPVPSRTSALLAIAGLTRLRQPWGGFVLLVHTPRRSLPMLVREPAVAKAMPSIARRIGPKVQREARTTISGRPRGRDGQEPPQDVNQDLIIGAGGDGGIVFFLVAGGAIIVRKSVSQDDTFHVVAPGLSKSPSRSWSSTRRRKFS